jgi:ribonuclease R
MDFSISTLLSSFGDDKLIAPKLLEKKLECNDPSSLQDLQITLDALDRIGVLAKERGKYRRVYEDGVVEGKLRCSSKGFCFAIQDGEGTEDIYIRESHLNTAWNGDRVLVKVTKEGRRRRSPEGEVRLILERSNPSVLAHVQTATDGSLRAVPLDDRLLFELDLCEAEEGPPISEAVDQLVHVEVLRYPLGRKRPIGRISKILGSDAQSAADTELVYCKYDLPREFPAAVEAAAEALPRKLRKSDLKKRIPLQKLPTLSFYDPVLAEVGVSHAFSVEKNKAGQSVLWIHAVDFTPFVPLNSVMDLEARARAACMVLGNSVVPLFPAAMVERVGTLEPNQERLALSLMVILDAQGEVQTFELQPSVVKVDDSLPLGTVEGILSRTQSPVTDEVKAAAAHYGLVDQLHQVAQGLQRQRYQRGSFDLWGPEPLPNAFGDEGLYGAAVITPPEQTKAMVSEFLMLANRLILEHMNRLELPVVYQHQLPPDVQDIQDVLKLSENLGWTFDPAQESVVSPQDFQAFAQAFRGSAFAPMLFDLLSMVLEPVTVSAESGPHFAQAVGQHFGHYTAPCHRYADFLNQQVLHATFNKGRDRRNSQAKEGISLGHSSSHNQINWNVLPPSVQRDLEMVIAESIPRLNERLQLILQATKDLAGLQKTKKMQQHIGEVFSGVITGIQSYGFFVRLESLRVEGLVHVSSLKDDWYEYRSRQQTLIGRKNRRQYRLGDQVEVEVKSVDYYRQQIDLVAVGGGSEASEEDLSEAVTTTISRLPSEDLLDLEDDLDLEDMLDSDLDEDPLDEDLEEEDDLDFVDALDEDDDLDLDEDDLDDEIDDFDSLDDGFDDDELDDFDLDDFEEDD